MTRSRAKPGGVSGRPGSPAANEARAVDGHEGGAPASRGQDSPAPRARSRARAVGWALLAAWAGLGLAGCGGVPTTGPVLSQDRPGPAQGEGDIAVDAQGPAQGAQPAAIIDGFILAMAKYEPGYSTARQFLTGPASAAWNSDSVRIYADLAGLTMTSETTARITAQLVGQLNPGGTYTAAPGTTSTLDFGLTQDEQGQWRISSLPADLGVVVTRARFTSAFQRLDAYYFDDQFRVLIPDTRYLPRGRWLRQLLGALLAGPARPVAAITDASVVSSVSLALDAEPTLDADGVVTIPLAPGGVPLGRTTATRLAVQCAATLRQTPGVTGVRLLRDGQIVPVDGLTAQGSFPLAGVARYDPFVAPAREFPTWGARDGLVVNLDQGVWPGDLGTTARPLTSLAVAPAGAGRGAASAAVVTPTGLTLGVGNAPPQEVVAAPGLVRPQFDRDGRLWAMATAPADGASAVWLVGQAGVVQPAAPALAGRAVRAFRVSPDGRRAALIVDVAVDGVVHRRVGVVQIRVGGDGQFSVDGWRDVPVVVDGADLGAIADVVWVGPSTLDIVGLADGSQINAVYAVGLDGVEPPEEIGRPSDAAVVELTTSGGVLIALDANGEAFRWVDAHAWESLGAGLSAVA